MKFDRPKPRGSLYQTGRWLNFAFSLLLLSAVIACTALFKDELLSASISASLKMQRLHSDFLTGWFKFFAGPMYFLIYILQFLLLFYLREKSSALKIFVLVQFSFIVAEFVKLVTVASRPCFLSEELASAGCSCSYGMPSGHSLEGVLFYLLLYTELFARITRRPCAKACWLLLVLFIAANICLSRLYLGAHALDQILLGACLGYFIFSLAWLFESQLDMGMQSMIQFDASQRTRRVVTFFLVAIPFVALYVLNWVFWKKRRSDFEQPPEKQFIVSSCRGKCLKNGFALADAHLLTMSTNSVPIPLFLLLLTTIKSNTLYNPNYYVESFSRCGKFLKRFLVFFIVCLPILLSQVVSEFFKVWIEALIIFGANVIFSLLFVYDLSKLLQAFKVEIKGDYFIDKGYDPFDPTISEVELYRNVSHDI